MVKILAIRSLVPRLRRRPRSHVVAFVVAIALAAAVGAVSIAGTLPQKALNPLDQLKQAALDKEAADRAARPIAPKPDLAAGLPHGTPYPIPPREAGLLHETNQGPFAATDFHGQDLWQDQVGGTWVLVFAGTDLTSTGAGGALRLYSMPVDPNAPGGSDAIAVGTYRPPTSEKSLGIVSAQGATLDIRGGSGTFYKFNVLNKTWQPG